MQIKPSSIFVSLFSVLLFIVEPAECGQRLNKFRTAVISTHKPFFDISVKYPVVKGLPNAINLNKLIRQVALKEIEKYECGIGESGKKTVRGYLKIDYQVTLANNDAFSLRFQIDKYDPNAAHPSEEIATINYCPLLGKKLLIRDIFETHIDYPAVLSVLCQNKLLKRDDFIDFYSPQS